MEAQNGGAPVVLNVYDLTPMNNYLYWFGLGIFHSGIEGAYCLVRFDFFFCLGLPEFELVSAPCLPFMPCRFLVRR
jgi:hypothetical protein